MVLSRVLDERIWLLGKQGKAHFVISSHGHEAAEIGSAYAINVGHDYVVPYYRSLALMVGMGIPIVDILLHFMGRQGDPHSGARQMGGHYGYGPKLVVSGSSGVGTQIPHAAGLGLAIRVKQEDRVVWSYFGEGATSQGNWHETLNFAAIHRLPVVFICENNEYAISVHQSRQMPLSDVADRARAYGCPGAVVNGNDLFEVYRVASAAAQRARDGAGPTLIEAKTYRLVPHSSADDDRSYRTREEVEAWRQRDPLCLVEGRLIEHGHLSESSVRQVWMEATTEVDTAIEIADAAPYPPVDDLYGHVYAES